MSVIDHNEIEINLGRTLSDAEIEQVYQWIGDAELLIANRLGGLDSLDQPTLEYVVRHAVLEQMRNPDGVSEETESIDDYAHTKKYWTKRVTIWPEWWAMLAPAKVRRAFSVMPS